LTNPVLESLEENAGNDEININSTQDNIYDIVKISTEENHVYHKFHRQNHSFSALSRTNKKVDAGS